MNSRLFRAHHFIGMLVATATLTGLLSYGCSDDEPAGGNDAGSNTPPANPPPNPPGNTPPSGPTLLKATANITPTTDGGTVEGTVTFEEIADGGVTMTMTVEGASPGLHGFHIHQNGNCGRQDGDAAAPPGSGAGGHWNVDGDPHAFPGDPEHHTGDMGNVNVDMDGNGSHTLTNTQWTVKEGQYSVVGKAVIFHAGEDDGRTQPTGDAGARPGCGIITLSN